MKKTMLVSSAERGPFVLHRCTGEDGCGNTFLASSKDKFCPLCATALTSQGTPVSTKDEITASITKDKKLEFVCASCHKHIIVSGTDESAEDLENKLYCTSCGSPEIEQFVENPDEDTVAQGVQCEADSAFSNSDAELKSNMGVDEANKGMTEGGSEEVEEATEDNAQDSEEDVQDSLELVSSDDDDLSQLQMSAMTMSNGDEVIMGFSKNAEPLFRIRKSQVHEQAHPIFATKAFYQVLHQRAKDVGLFAAIKDFNGEFYKPGKVAQKSDMEAMAIDYMQKMMFPKFMDCIATALEGSVKGLFPEQTQELKASMFDELTARIGAPEDRVADAIQSTVSSNGMAFFTSIIAKACELMQKPEGNYSEIKAMVQASKTVSTVAFAGSEQMALRNRLENGNVPISIQEPTSRNRSSVSASVALGNASVQSMRQALQLGRK